MTKGKYRRHKEAQRKTAQSQTPLVPQTTETSAVGYTDYESLLLLLLAVPFLVVWILMLLYCPR